MYQNLVIVHGESIINYCVTHRIHAQGIFRARNLTRTDATVRIVEEKILHYLLIMSLIAA